MASSSSVYSRCHSCTISYFISLSVIETAAQCNIMETKTLNKRKSHHKNPERLIAIVFSCSQTALPAQRKRGVLTLKRNRPLLHSQGPWASAGTHGLGSGGKLSGSSCLTSLLRKHSFLLSGWSFQWWRSCPSAPGVTQEWTKLIKCTCLSFEKKRKGGNW